MRALAKILLPIVALAIGAGAVVLFIKLRPEPPRRKPPSETTLVHVMTAKRTDEEIRVTAMGTVVPAQLVVMQPEVSGRIVGQNPKLEPGGRLAQGDPIVQIDKRDYTFAVQQARSAATQARDNVSVAEANVQRAEFELAVEEGRQTIAKAEWERLKDEIDSSEAGRRLALREPHLANAKAGVASAKAAKGSAEAAVATAESRLAQAILNQQRTTIQAPFNAVVREESVDKGQMVNPQTRLATLCGTDRYWVQVTVPVDRLSWIELPKPLPPTTQPLRESGTPRPKGAKATIIHEGGPGVRIVRKGYVVRLLSDVETAGRMARLLVEIEDPLELKKGEAAGLPLLLGAYVRVEINARRLDNVVVLPRAALREGNQVWIMDKDDQLEIREKLSIPWRRRDAVLVADGIAEGERIVISRIGTPLKGMKLKVQAPETKPAGATKPEANPPSEGQR